MYQYSSINRNNSENSNASNSPLLESIEQGMPYVGLSVGAPNVWKPPRGILRVERMSQSI